MEQMRKGEAAVDLKIASQQEKKSTKPLVLKAEPVMKTTVADKVSIVLLIKISIYQYCELTFLILN